MRAFVAIEISDEVRAALVRAQQELGRCGAKVKWVEPENVHLTLKFLGDVDALMIEQVKAAMAESAGGSASLTAGGPFHFSVEGLGSFPPRRTPRVVWAGVSAGADAAVRLQAGLEAALRPLGFEKERDFVPHLTIGRVKAPQGAERLVPAIKRHAHTRFGSCSAAEMVLFESKLTPSGAVYAALARQALY